MLEVKRTRPIVDLGCTNEDQQQKEVESDYVYIKGIPRNYKYKDIKRDLFA